MINIFRAVTDCNRFILDSDSVKPSIYFARAISAWLAAMMVFGVHVPHKSGIFFQAMLLLLIFSSRIGCHPIKLGSLIFVGCFWFSMGGVAYLCTSSLTNWPFPTWKAYAYASLVLATWMTALFLSMTVQLFEIHITGQNSLGDIAKSLKEKGLAKIPELLPGALLIFLTMIFLIIIYIFFVRNQLSHISAIMVTDMFVFAVLICLPHCGLISHYSKHLNS